MNWPARLAALASPLLASTLLAPCASACHLGPPIWLELLVEDSSVRLTLSGEPLALQKLLGEELDLVGPLDPEAQAHAEESFAALFEEVRPLSISGEPARGRLTGVELPVDDDEESGWLIVHARYEVALAEPPRSVGIHWERYEGATWQGEEFLPLTVLCGRRVCGQGMVYPKEPEYVWHPDPESSRPSARDLRAVVVDREPETLRIPALSLGMAAGAVLLFVVARRKERLRTAAVAGSFLALLAAAGLREVGLVEVRSPLERVVARPSLEEARAIFETLHRGIYDAFSAETEDEIYDRLAVSVDRSLLDDLYGEIYESLILREQGGAVCSIESVEVLDGEVHLPTDPDAPPGFQVDWTWQVNGVVSHWGHLHHRRNEYEALYTVGHDGTAWRITGVDVLEHRRIDLPDPVLGPGGSASASGE